MPGPASKLVELMNAAGPVSGVQPIDEATLMQRLAERRAMREPSTRMPPRQRPQPGAIAARRKELMAQGMNAMQALEHMGNEGLVDPRLVERMLRVPKAAQGL
jgi:hypothetical protein